MNHGEECEHCAEHDQRHFELLLHLRDKARKHLKNWTEAEEKALVIPDIEDFIRELRNAAAVTNSDHFDTFLVNLANQLQQGIREIFEREDRVVDSGNSSN